MNSLLANLANVLLLPYFLSFFPEFIIIKLDNPLLVTDLENHKEVKNFRSTYDPSFILSLGSNRAAGLVDLNASASGAFTEDFLISLKQVTGDSPLYIIDLRQESHGYADGVPISWYGYRNRANDGLPFEKVLAKEYTQIANLKNDKAILANEIIEKKDGIIEKISTVTIKAKKIETEEELLNRLGIGYVRIPVLDKYRPQDQQVDQFVEFIRYLPKNAKLHIHCRAGKGRSTTFMILYDIINNANMLGLQEIVDRQGEIGPKNLSHLPPSSSRKFGPHVERLNFLEAFYSYVKDPNGYAKTTWSEWAKSHSNLPRDNLADSL